ncbi:Alpha/beta hydrolase [Candidatus Electrothrix aarhusensis]
MNDYHVIHSKGGKIGNGADTSIDDIDRLVKFFIDSGSGNLAIHVHGGLVNKSAGMATAERLHDVYATDSFPIFYIWESGVWETIRNNLTELADEPVFKQLVRKLLKYSLDRLSGSSGGRSILPGSVDAGEVSDVINSFWSTPSKGTIPYRDFQPNEDDTGARSVGMSVNQSEIQADLETDEEFKRALSTLPDLLPGTRSAMGGTDLEEHRSGFSEALADQVSDVPGTRGLISWFKVARLVARILKAVLKRYASGRDHGLYATIVEEIVRGVKIGGSGLNEWGKALQWNRMKKDVRDAFGTDVDLFAGTALLERLRRALEAGKRIDRITVIGHSTGAIYIAEWLTAADNMLPSNVKFDVVFLAPAITYERFASCLTNNGDRIRSFRSFAMTDELERDDQVWGDDSELDDGADLRRFIYPSSLLYLVSGILESDIDEAGNSTDSPDKPLLGMERYYAKTRVYDAADFPEVQQVRSWLEQQSDRLVWSIASGQPEGFNSASIDHGAFDNDPDTLASVRAILRG